MSNYKETRVVGQEYIRCSEIKIVNPYQKTPSVSFGEERATLLSDRTILDRAGELTISFDPSKVIKIINPITGLDTGTTITYGEIYSLLYSAYMDAALQRDLDATKTNDLL